MSDDELARFFAGMVWIVEDTGQGVGEYSECFVEPHAVLLEVLRCLDQVSLKRQRRQVAGEHRT